MEVIEPDVTGLAAIVLSDADGNTVTVLKRGENHVVTTEVQGTPTTLINGEAVLWSIAGNASTRTRIFQTGILQVSPEETGTQITVTATSATDENLTATATYNVTGDRVVQWPNPEVIPDADNDGLGEVTPKPLTVDADKNVTIPTITGVQYKKAGTNVKNGSVHKLTAPTVFTAEARPGYELAPGAPASWTLAP